jgi:hypothetical protein
MPHDQIFKELLRAFFREFLELFLPDIAARLDFSTVRFLEQEIFTDFPAGDPRRADNIAEVRTTDGEPELVLFHIEAEARRRSEFRFRMWEYYSLIRFRAKRPVYPIIIYLSPGTGGIVREEYTEVLFDETLLSFRFAAVGLPDLSADDYRESENLLGVALSALMQGSGIGPVLQKWQAIRRILTSSLDESRKILLATVVENYLLLSEEAEEEYLRVARSEMPEEVQSMLSIYEERGIAKGIARGIEQGIAEGILRGQRQLLLKQLRAKFGELPETAVTRVQAMEAPDLDALAESLLKAEALAEVGLS